MSEQKAYTVAPFNPVVPEKASTEQRAVRIAQQMSHVINDVAGRGWAFESYAEVRVGVKPGCLGAMFGGNEQTTFYGMLVFSRRQ